MDIVQIIKKSFQDLKFFWGVVLLASLPITLLPNIFLIHQTLGLFLILVLSGALRAGLSKICLTVVDKKPINLAFILEGFLYFKNALGVFLLSTVFIVLGLFAFIIPGIVIAILLSQSYFILVENPELEPLEVFKKSRNLIKGFELSYFSLLLLFTSITVLFFLINLPFLSILIVPIEYIVMTNFYKSLKENTK